MRIHVKSLKSQVRFSSHLHYRLVKSLIIPIWAKSKAKKARIGEKSIIPVLGRMALNIFKIGSVSS